MTTEREVQVYADPVALARAAAMLVVTETVAAIAARGMAHIVLSGGSTPAALYRLLADAPYRAQVDWARVVLWFGDERCVPPDHAESNYRMAYEALLRHVPAQVRRMQGELEPAQAATGYEAALRAAFPEAVTPRFDLVLLGMGDDGHTASLFPHTSALDEREAWCVANYVPQLHTTRLTLTYPALNGAACVAFLVAGAGKRARLQQVLGAEVHPHDWPAQGIAPHAGRLLWLLDAAAT